MKQPVLSLLSSLLVVSLFVSAAAAQEICPPWERPTSTTPSKPYVAPTEFTVQQREGEGDETPLLFVGDSLIGGMVAKSAGDRLPFVVSAASAKPFSALSMSGQTSVVIAETFLKSNVEDGDKVLVVWMGRNNVGSPEQVISDIKTVIEHAKTDKFLVLNVPVSTRVEERPDGSWRPRLDKLNAMLKDAFEDRFVTVDSEITCNDRADFVHFNASGQQKIARVVIEEIARRGW